MRTQLPKNDTRFHWTSHIKDKMMYYRISEQKIKAILKSADRREEGIAPHTVAAMKRNDRPKRKEEIWIMYQTKSNLKDREKKSILKQFRRVKYTMISAWRYPGTTKPGERPEIPDDVLEEIKNLS